MEDPKKVYDNLQQLLVELQKVKDLNNLANEYKAISAKLILSLQDYLKDGRAFSDSFNTYLEQTNKCVEETKNSLDGIVNTVNTTVSAFKVADGTIEKKTDNLSEILCQLKQQATLVEGLYGNCMEIEKQVRIDFENMTAKAIDAFSLQSNVVSGRLDSLNSPIQVNSATRV